MKKVKEKIDDFLTKILIVSLIVLGIVLLYKLFLFRTDRKSQLRNELLDLDSREEIYNKLSKKRKREIEIIERINQYLPLIIRICLVIILMAVDTYIFYMSKSIPISSILDITPLLKEITIWNVTILSFITLLIFVFQGTYNNTEKTIDAINRKIHTFVFVIYFKNKEKSINEHNRHSYWYNEYIEKIKQRKMLINNELAILENQNNLDS